MACDNPAIVRIGIDVDTFKNKFKRGFNYLPAYDASKIYNAGDIVYYVPTTSFYTCKNNGVQGVLPTDTNDWSFVKLSTYDYVLDEDIENAFDEACMKFNDSLFQNDTEITLGYLYLTAHFLVGDLGADGANSSSAGFVASRSVGNVSESYSIPAWSLKSPAYSFLTTTYYGVKYLNMIYSRTRGNMKAVWSGTNA